MLNHFSTVNIVGFSIAGILTSLALQKHTNINIYEQHKKNEHNPFCSGVLSINAVNYIKKYFFNPMKAKEQYIFGANIHLGNKLLQIYKKQPVAIAFNRREFDLLGREHVDAHIMYGKRLNIADVLKLKKPIIGTDGLNSVVARAYKFPKIKKFVYAFYTYSKGKENQYVELFLNKNFPGFFGWIIPHGNYNEYGFGVVDRKYIKQGIKFFKLNNNVKWKGSAIPIRIRSKLSGKGVFLVGDSAGTVKSSTGGGIYYTAQSVNLLKRAILENKDFDKLMKPIKKEILMHSLIQSMFELFSPLNYIFIDSILKLIQIDKILEKHGNMDNPSEIINSIFFNNNNIFH